MVLTGMVWHKWSRPEVQTCADKNGNYKTFNAELRHSLDLLPLSPLPPPTPHGLQIILHLFCC